MLGLFMYQYILIYFYTLRHHKRYVIKLLNLIYGRTVGIKQSRYTKNAAHAHTIHIIRLDLVVDFLEDFEKKITIKHRLSLMLEFKRNEMHISHSFTCIKIQYVWQPLQVSAHICSNPTENKNYRSIMKPVSKHFCSCQRSTSLNQFHVAI